MEKFKKIGVIFTTILIIFLCIVCYDSKVRNYKDIELSKKQQEWIHDMEQLRTILEGNIGMNYRLSDDKRNQKIDKIISEIKEEDISDIKMYHKMSELFSDIEVGHLTFQPANIQSKNLSLDKDGRVKDAMIYPIGGMWFGEEFRIVNVLSSNEEVAGGVLEKINGISFDKILKKYDSIFINETSGGLKNVFQRYNYNFFLKEYMDYLKITKNNKANFTIKKDGKEIDVELEAIKVSELETVNYIYTLSEIEASMQPMWYKTYHNANNLPFTYVHDFDNYAIYFQYNSCVDNTSKHLASYREDLPNFQEFFDNMIWYMQQNPGTYSQFIIDLRHNLGGDYYLISDAIDRHMAFLQTQNIKVIIGDNYSAGHMAVEDILRISPNIKIYGEESSSAIKNYTEITNSKFVLDNCKWKVQVPMKEDFRDNLKNRQKEWEHGIIPDFYVSQTYDDFLTGIDTVYYYTILN